MLETILLGLMMVVTCMVGYFQQSLTFSGAFAAFFIGMAVYSGIGIRGIFLLGIFFVTSSSWSKYKSSLKIKMEEKLAKGARRDWLQVVANGGAAGLFSIIYYFDDDFIWLIGFVVCLASANSDTWASEIGSLSKKAPIYIRTFKRIEKGTSGAVSLLGTIAGIAGAFLISFLSFVLFDIPFYTSLIIFLFGFVGNIIDTLIGAFYQQGYVCKQCGIETEKKVHCRWPTTRIKGLTYVDNDMVNFLSGFLAAVMAIVFISFTNY